MIFYIDTHAIMLLKYRLNEPPLLMVEASFEKANSILTN